MLTPIAWWGGLIFIAWAGCYRMMAVSQRDQGWVARAVTHLVYPAHGVLLAGFFYALPARGLQYAYAACWALALALLLYYVFDDLREAAGAEPASAAGAGDTADAADDRFYTVLGHAMVYGPLLLICALGAARLRPLLPGLW